MKLYHYPEEPTVLWAAKVVGRPMRWTGTRSEFLASDTHARDHHTVGRIAFDADTGQYLSGTFMDYAIPRAADLPSFALDSNATLDPDNPRGIKGSGESGTRGVQQITQFLTTRILTTRKIWHAHQEVKAG